MLEEKQTARKSKKFLWMIICSYFLIVAGYCLGKVVGEQQDLEYRFWVDACFRIWVWFVPLLFMGITLLKACVRKWKQHSLWKWILTVLSLGYIGVALYFSFIYVLVALFTLTFDEKMPDGNLVVAVPHGMESVHHYAEPVGLLFRREFAFDAERTADSLSKIYGVPFEALREESGQWIYGSEAYPEIEVTNILYGFMESNYLDNNFSLALTSKMLEVHQDVFASQGIELVSYIFGQSEANPEGKGIYTAVLVSEENKERVANAIAEFIKLTLKEDLRPDGKSIWDCVDGSVFLVVETEESGKYQSIRNIPFARKPQYSWIFDASVTAEEIAEGIVIKEEKDDKAEDELMEYIEKSPETLESSNHVTEENSQALLDHYLSIEPSCTFVTEDGLEYRMVGVDRALGSSFYVLIGVEEQGRKCTFVNPDPYNGSGGEARWIAFLNEDLGFSCLAYSAGSQGSLYRTEDGGSSWKDVEYPSANVKLSDGTYYNPFVMPEKVYEEDGILYMEAGQGTDGDRS